MKPEKLLIASFNRHWKGLPQFVKGTYKEAVLIPLNIPLEIFVLNNIYTPRHTHIF